MRTLIYTMSDGSVRFGRICREDGSLSSGLQRRIAAGLSETDAIAQVAEKDKPAGTFSWRLGDSTDLPGGTADWCYDKTFFGAMEPSGTQVVVNMAKARPIHMDHIRIARDAELLKKDAEWMNATGQKDTAAADAIEAERQILRDIPQAFDLTVATTPEELKVLWPAELLPTA